MQAVIAGVVSFGLVSGFGLSNVDPDFSASNDTYRSPVSIEVDSELDAEILIEIPQLPDDLDIGLLFPEGSQGRLAIRPYKIGDPHPIYPGARVCSETRYDKSDVAKTIQKLGSDTSTVSKFGYTGALAWISKKLAARGLGAIGLAWSILNAVKHDPLKWWANALAKITVGQARYVEHRVYCNYGGGYPAA